MYIVIEIQTNADGTVGNIVTAYPTRDAAFSKYHQILSAAAISALPVHSAVILDKYGFQIASQHFEHEIIVPENDE